MSRYRHYNPNPIKANASDCVIRMLTLVTGQPWAQCYLDVVEKGLAVGDMPSSNATWIPLLLDMGFKRYSLPDTCPIDCYTIEDFAIEHPQGEYVVGTGTHVVCIKDGFVWDSWDSTAEIPIFYLRR